MTNDYLCTIDGIGYRAGELSAIFSNLAKGCEKQYKPEMAGLYRELADYCEGRSERDGGGDFVMLRESILFDLDSLFPPAGEEARVSRDRGALRALKWAGQVSRIIKSHLGRMKSGEPEHLADTNVYVCEICGFIYAGDNKPEICPVCKVPSMKMTMIKRRA